MDGLRQRGGSTSDGHVSTEAQPTAMVVRSKTTWYWRMSVSPRMLVAGNPDELMPNAYTNLDAGSGMSAGGTAIMYWLPSSDTGRSSMPLKANDSVGHDEKSCGVSYTTYVGLAACPGPAQKPIMMAIAAGHITSASVALVPCTVALTSPEKIDGLPINIVVPESTIDRPAVSS